MAHLGRLTWQTLCRGRVGLLVCVRVALCRLLDESSTWGSLHFQARYAQFRCSARDKGAKWRARVMCIFVESRGGLGVRSVVAHADLGCAGGRENGRGALAQVGGVTYILYSRSVRAVCCDCSALFVVFEKMLFVFRVLFLLFALFV